VVTQQEANSITLCEWRQKNNYESNGLPIFLPLDTQFRTIVWFGKILINWCVTEFLWICLEKAPWAVILRLFSIELSELAVVAGGLFELGVLLEQI
jgi:hypothetical protein